MVSSIHSIPLSSSSSAPSQSEGNYMKRIVQWLRNEDNPLLLKIFAVACASAAVVTAASLTGHVIIVSLIVGLPTLIWAGIEWQMLVDQEKEAAEAAEMAKRRAIQQAESLQKMQDAVGGQAVFNAYPELDLAGRRGSTDYIDFLSPHELTHSVMRGIDRFQRPFISLKLRANLAGGGFGPPFVVTLFQRYTDRGLWTYGIAGGARTVFNDVINDTDRAAIRQIVITRDHPAYSLA